MIEIPKTPWNRWWLIAYWILFSTFMLAGLLNMMDVSGGFMTNHLADLVGPAWLYIVFRRLHNPKLKTRLYKFLGYKPEISALVLFAGSSITEVSQYYWPKGIFPGTFDPLDILVYGIGIGVCYVVDKRCSAQEMRN